jgi:tetratricopeptide (TPR) repeat protein
MRQGLMQKEVTKRVALPDIAPPPEAPDPEILATKAPILEAPTLEVLAPVKSALEPPASARILSDLVRRAREGSAQDVLAYALTLPRTVQDDPAVSIEIAKFARAADDREAMLRYGQLAYQGAPSNGPIANTYAEMLMREGRDLDAIVALCDAFCRSKDAILASHLRAAGRALQSKGLSAAHKASLGQTVARLADVLSVVGEPHDPHITEVCIELNGLVGAAQKNVTLLSNLLAPLAVEHNVTALAEASSLQQALAEIDFSDLLSAIPEAITALFAHAVALEYDGQFSEAIAILRGLIDQPMATEEMVLRAARLEIKEATGAGLVILDSALRRFPGSIAIARALIDAAVSVGDLAHAEIAAGQVFRDHPDDEASALKLIRILTWQQKFFEAFAIAQSQLDRGWQSAALFEAAAHAARGAERKDLALEYVRKAIDLEPKSTTLLRFYAELAIAAGDISGLGSILDEFFLQDSNPDLAEQAVRILVALTWSRIPDYVDNRHVELLQTLVEAHLFTFDVDLLWEVVRMADRIGLYDFAGKALATAIERTNMQSADLPQNAVHFINHISRSNFFPAPNPYEREASARRLMSAGLAAVATLTPRRAEVAFRLAAALAPGNAAAKINAGFADLMHGSVMDAWKHFEAITRVYSDDMDNVVWPAANLHRPWPMAPFAHQDAFDALKPTGVEWPLITVITPSYNQGAYLEETILSVLHQGYPRLQYIVVDGLSTDQSIEIIKTYERRLDATIIEKDNGQTDAINKGLALAKGEIITWINSDDMLAPGALHVAALTWLRSKADLLYGACLAHKEYHFTIANLPAVDPDTFTLQHLGQIFKYWMKGYFFYQPEVFFTRRILDAAGGFLDASLYYTMDYKFWLQCAQNHARIEQIRWPIAFFRQHQEQKTANLLDCVLEQAEVRDQFVRIEPPAPRQLEVRGKLQKAFTKRVVKVGVVSSRLAKIFSAPAPEHLPFEFENGRFRVELVDASGKLNEPDLIIKLIHLQADMDEIRKLRSSGYNGAMIGWFWDNHHHLFDNFAVSEQLDVVLPGHAFAAAYLRNRQAVQGPSVPLCVTQWTGREAENLYASLVGLKRRDQLYGGFVRYAFAKKRNNLIEDLTNEGHKGVSFLEETNLAKYFDLSSHDRFEEWMSHKVSICLPLAGDLSQRLFDALLTGQVPIVPSDVRDLDAVISPELQAKLPIIRFNKYDASEVLAAHRLALDRFNSDGDEGALRRHRFVLEGHTFSARIREILRISQTLLDQL